MLARDILLAEDVVCEPLSTHIDPESFTPRLLALVSNALVSRESGELRRRFGMGTNEWRVLSALAIRPGTPASEISEFLGLNKATVSKAVGVLVAHDLIVLSDGSRGSRPIYLTHAGADIHRQMLPISQSGQDLILKGMSTAEVIAFNDVLHRMIRALRQESELDIPAPNSWPQPAPSARRAPASAADRPARRFTTPTNGASTGPTC